MCSLQSISPISNCPQVTQPKYVPATSSHHSPAPKSWVSSAASHLLLRCPLYKPLRVSEWLSRSAPLWFSCSHVHLTSLFWMSSLCLALDLLWEHSPFPQEPPMRERCQLVRRQRQQRGCAMGLKWGFTWEWDFPGNTSGEEPACQCRRCKRCRFDPRVGKIPWRRAWQPTPVFLSGESHGQRNWWATVHGVTKSRICLGMHIAHVFVKHVARCWPNTFLLFSPPQSPLWWPAQCVR